jgi:hypothetical protein
MICSFECTFCVLCVANVLEDVSQTAAVVLYRVLFVRRSIGAATTTLASVRQQTTAKLRPINVEAHREFAKSIKRTPPTER